MVPLYSSNATALAAYIERTLGPRHLPLSTIVPISAVYAVIFVLGVLGNVSTCLVIFRNKYMQTPTNVYLANLAVSDLLTHLVGKKICPQGGIQGGAAKELLNFVVLLCLSCEGLLEL